MPGPTYVTGAELPVTWEDAYREAVAAYVKAEARNTVLSEKLEECGAKLVAAEARIAALEAGVDHVAIGVALDHARSIVSILEPMDGGGS